MCIRDRLQLVRGRIESLDVTGSGVRLPNGVTLERLDINTKSLAVDPRTGAVDNIGSMRFIALVSQNELSNYLAKSNPEIHDLDLALNDDGFIPVSYTHLDVYKRQMCSLPFQGRVGERSDEASDKNLPGNC